MPGYIEKVLRRFEHFVSMKETHTPYLPPPRAFGNTSQDPIRHDESETIDKQEIKVVQQVVGCLLYYARAFDCTILTALSSIASQQTTATRNTEYKFRQILNYLATQPDTTIHFQDSSMILNIHSNALYLSKPQARSRLAGYYFLGSESVDNRPIPINGNIFFLSSILKFLVSLAAEAELRSLFLNAKEGDILRLILHEMGHLKSPTPIHCDDKTTVGIANDSVKKQISQSMEMRFF